jgi:peptide/nickel transport system permease protein
MLTFLLRRLIALPLVLLAITILLVLVMQLISPEKRAGAFIRDPRQFRNIAKVIQENGLDQPFYVQYGHWISGAVQGNLGFSRASNQAVFVTIRERLPATLELTLLAGTLIVASGIWLGTLAALRKDQWPDHVWRVLAVLGYSLPTFVLGIWLLVIFYGGLNLLPGSGRVSDDTSILMATGEMRSITGLITIDAILGGRWDVLLDALTHLFLPVATLVIVSSAQILKAMRAAMLEVLGADYVRTARAKGLPTRAIHLKHARKNALITVVTLAGVTVSGLLQGAVLTEAIFAFPGIGSWGAKAATMLDFPGVLGFALIAATITVIANIAVDLLYAMIDPRVRFE